MKQEDDIPADRWRGDAGTGALSSKKPIIIRLGDNWPACVSQECVGNSLLLIRLLAAYLIFMSSFLPGRSVRKRTIAHQLVNEEGKRNSLPPLLLLLLLLPPPNPPRLLRFMSAVSPVANETWQRSIATASAAAAAATSRLLATTPSVPQRHCHHSSLPPACHFLEFWVPFFPIGVNQSFPGKRRRGNRRRDRNMDL